MFLNKRLALEHLIHEVQPMNRAFDLANFTPVPTPQQLDCLKAQGYTRAIVGSSFGSVWQQQIAACAAAGLEIHEYQFPNATKATHNPWWLDCETDVSTVPAIRAICKWPNPPTGIYTRRNWWNDNTGGWNISAEFPWLKLWDAAYGPVDAPFVPYGGFTARAMHQYVGSASLCGLNLDLNIIEEGTRMYSDADIDAKLNDLKGAVQGTFGLALRTAQSDSQLGRDLADHIQKTGTTNDAAMLAALKQRMDDNDARLANIGKILAP